MNFKKTRLSNGLRIITVPVKDNPSVMVLVAVETGSNYESIAENGLSHFLEHMCFKGTTKRPGVSDVVRELDGLGAQNNAFTSNEFTAFYAKSAKKNFSKIFELVSDLYLNPTLLQQDIDKEKGVILQEISMYEDLPQRKVHDLLMELLYGKTSFGRTILGLTENIKKFSRSDFINYRRKHYISEKTIVVVSGDISHREIEKNIRKYFGNIPQGRPPKKPKIKEIQKIPGLKIYKKKTDQTHMLLAFRMFSAKDKRIPAVNILATILGQGMSSRLFVKLRDEMGACYYIRASADDLSDYGIFTVAVGIEAKRARDVTKVITSECRKLCDDMVPAEELAKAKEHYIGHFYMDLETTEMIAEFYAGQEVATSKLKSPKEIEKSIRKVTAKDVMKVAKDIFKNDRLNLAIVGDVSDQKSIKKVLSFK